MYYECPACHSPIRPRIVRHYPRKIAKCTACALELPEQRFVREGDFDYVSRALAKRLANVQ